MFNIFKRFFVILILIFVTACSSNNYNDETTRVVTEHTVTTIDDIDDTSDDDFCDEGCDYIEFNDDFNDDLIDEDLNDTKVEKKTYFAGLPQYDSKLLYREIDNQIKKVEIKRTLVKPVYNTNRNPVNLNLDEIQDVINSISDESELEDGIDYDNKTIMVLIDNYKNILKASYSCCVANITEELKRSNISRDSILQFLNLDANEYAFQNMCVFVNNKDVKDVYNNKVLSSIVSKVKNNCICNNADFIHKNLNNFYKLYNEKPELYDEVLVYRFKDKKGRIVEHNINETISNITNVLNNCVK
ncbi:MAG: hypothetical protein ACI4N3_02540 [Alphaproteobacteria bacterium]